MEMQDRAAIEIELPAPTAWPVVLAAGVTLMFAGLLTAASVSVLGAVLAIVGCVGGLVRRVVGWVGWFREVLPRAHELVVTVVPDEVRVSTERRIVERLPI